MEARSSSSAEIPSRVKYLQAKQNVSSLTVAIVCGLSMIALGSPSKWEFMVTNPIQSVYLINMMCDINEAERRTGA